MSSVEHVTAGDDVSQVESELRAEIARLNKVVRALMDRAERSTSVQSSDFGLFQTAVMLEDQIRARTRELEDARNQLLQSEKLASIGQLAAGVAHEINNPIGFVNSNLGTLGEYVDGLLRLLAAYDKAVTPAVGIVAADSEILAIKEEIDLDFVQDDIRKLIAESIDGTVRVRRIVQDLRNFSRTGSPEFELADLHAGLESTLNVVANEIKYKADVVRDYGELPPVECVASQINQVFLNLLVNAAQAIATRGTITLRSGLDGDEVWVSVTDDGQGVPAGILPRIFDPFFTTKTIGSGTGLGLSLSYGIVQRHDGRIDVTSIPGVGTTFTVRLPLRQNASAITGRASGLLPPQATYEPSSRVLSS